MTWNQGLVGKALSIAEVNTKYLRVMAGPGTGKSFAMKRRVARLLEEGVGPRGILAVTFTRVAAANLVSELKALGVAGCDEIVAGTLHSFCFRLLNKSDVLDSGGRIPRPLVTFSKSKVLQFEAAPLLADIRLEGKRKDTKRILAFEAAWARLQSEEPGWPLDTNDRRFHDALISWLTFHRAMFIGEVVPEALKYLRNNPTAPERSAFRHVIVDEYQDLNRADQALLDLLIAGNAVVIGDENQSIYRFRYAHPAGIIEFGTGHLPTEDADLDECRRCPTRVVEIANHLIMHNHPQSSTPRLKPMAGNPEGEVNIVQWRTIADESRGIADYVASLIGQRKYLPKDILLLCPRRLIAYSVRDALAAKAVATHSYYHEEALEEDEAQRTFTLLTLLADPDDRVALRFWIGYGSANCLAGEYAKLRTYCEQTGLAPREVLDRQRDGTINLPGTSHLKARYDELCEILTSMQGLVGEELVGRLFPEGNSATKILREAALRMVEADTPPSRILNVLRTLITQPEMPEDTNCVRIMSLQKSKGLTSKVTIVTGCVQGLVPVDDSEETPAERRETLKEQRRLFYVAITRPTEILLLSSFANIQSDFAYKMGVKVRPGSYAVAHTITCQFIAELGPKAPPVKLGTDWRAAGYSNNHLPYDS